MASTASFPGSRFNRLARWFELDNAGPRYIPMEGLRGLAILLVFICHYCLLVAIPLGYSGDTMAMRLLVQVGGSGVDMFFVLSGFLIYRSAISPRLLLAEFLKRRVARVYPTFVIVFVCYLFLIWFAPGNETKLPQDHTLAYILSNALLLPGIVDTPAIVSAAWSLSYEFAFYLYLPMLAIVLQLSRRTHSRRMAVFAGLVAAHILAVAWFGASFPVYEYYDGTFVRMIMFIGGVFVYEITTRPARPEQDPRIVYLALLSAVACGLIAFVLLKSGLQATTFTLGHQQRLAEACALFVAYSTLAYLTLRADNWLARAFSWTPLRWLGNISFSFYLIHGLSLHILSMIAFRVAWVHTHSALALALLFVPFLLATFAAAAVLFVGFERPISLTRRPRPAATAPATRPVGVTQFVPAVNQPSLDARERAEAGSAT